MIDKNSTIHKRAKIGNNVKIGPYCVIEENVEFTEVLKLQEINSDEEASEVI